MTKTSEILKSLREFSRSIMDELRDGLRPEPGRSAELDELLAVTRAWDRNEGDCEDVTRAAVHFRASVARLTSRHEGRDWQGWTEVLHHEQECWDDTLRDWIASTSRHFVVSDPAGRLVVRTTTREQAWDQIAARLDMALPSTWMDEDDLEDAEDGSDISARLSRYKCRPATLALAGQRRLLEASWTVDEDSGMAMTWDEHDALTEHEPWDC